MSCFYTSSLSTSQYDLLNRNGTPLCHAIKCRKHTKLIWAYGGLFCHKHLVQISLIRQRIFHDISSIAQLSKEIEARTEEALFRKVMEPGHMIYLRTLEKIFEKLSHNQKF